MLVDSGNREYTRLYAERHEFLDKIRKLETRIEFLEEHQEKRERHFTETITNMGSKYSAPSKMSFAGRRDEALRTAFPLAYKSEDELSDIVDHIQNHPGLNFWATGSFKQSHEYSGTVAKRLRFLEDENGVPMTKKRLDVIRKFLSGAFRELKELMYDLLPKKGWATGADRELMARCHLELARRFRELSYCQDGWKPRALMVEWFPSFQRIHMPDAEIHNSTVKLEDSEEEEDGGTRATSVPAKRVAEPSKASRKKMKKEPEPRIPELEDPLAQKPSTGRVNKEPASKTIPELIDPPTSNNQQLQVTAILTVNPTPASTTSTTASTFKAPNELPQNAEPTSTNTTPTLKPTSTASTATMTNNTLDTDKSTIETNTINGNAPPDIPKAAPAMDAPPSIKLPGTSNVSTTGSSPSAPMPVMRNEQPRPRPLKLYLKLPPNPPRDATASSSPADDAPADDEPRPRSLQDVNKANPITVAEASVPEASATTSSGTGEGKKKAAARKGKKAVKEYVVDPKSTAPKDLFANNYLANPDNAEKTKAVDVLRAWNALNKEEKQGYFELSTELKRERKGEN
ncbi:hypothetical protein JOM56_006990 [Amanita muscaria]